MSDKNRGDAIKDIEKATNDTGRVMANFFKELELIKDHQIRKFTKEVLVKYTPGYFWIVPASTSGKYHHEDECNEGGLVKHVKRVVVMAQELMIGLGWFGHLGKEVVEEKKYEHDVIISACILHDILKAGFEGRERKVGENYSSDRMHPFYIRDRIYMQKMDDKYMYKMPFFDDIMRTIEGHYGFWSVLPQAVNLTEAQSPIFICYMADYISSRKNIANIFK